jgi:hypothetical protein
MQASAYTFGSVFPVPSGLETVGREAHANECAFARSGIGIGIGIGAPAHTPAASRDWRAASMATGSACLRTGNTRGSTAARRAWTANASRYITAAKDIRHPLGHAARGGEGGGTGAWHTVWVEGGGAAEDDVLGAGVAQPRGPLRILGAHVHRVAPHMVDRLRNPPAWMRCDAMH